MCKKFVYGVAVSDYNFIGRERETKRLLDNFKGGIATSNRNRPEQKAPGILFLR